MSRAPIALQLYSVRAEVEKDLPATLKEVASMGYKGVEPWGYDGSTDRWMNRGASEVRKLLDDHALACCGFHLSTRALLGDNLQRTIDYNQALGNRFLIIAGDHDRMKSPQGVDGLAKILIDVAKKLQPHGMFTGYHAHGFDFKEVGGQSAWDRLFDQLPRDVIMQLDTGNTADGGGDPIAILRKYPGRARSVHLKEHGGDPGAVIGQGTLDWKTIFELCDTTQPVEWYIVEEETTGGVGFEQARRSMEALQQMGRI